MPEVVLIGVEHGLLLPGLRHDRDGLADTLAGVMSFSVLIRPRGAGPEVHETLALFSGRDRKEFNVISGREFPDFVNIQHLQIPPASVSSYVCIISNTYVLSM